jgi:hypothetical protein
MVVGRTESVVLRMSAHEGKGYGRTAGAAPAPRRGGKGTSVGRSSEVGGEKGREEGEREGERESEKEKVRRSKRGRERE